MKTIIVKIDETKLSKNIPVEDLVEIVEGHIYDAIDYGIWYETFGEGDYGGNLLTDDEQMIEACTVEKAVSIEVVGE